MKAKTYNPPILVHHVDHHLYHQLFEFTLESGDTLDTMLTDLVRHVKVFLRDKTYHGVRFVGLQTQKPILTVLAHTPVGCSYELALQVDMVSKLNNPGDLAGALLKWLELRAAWYPNSDVS